jgi:mannitol/fructose-specific phosphotransferase system IIA component (Ntr-type)
LLVRWGAGIFHGRKTGKRQFIRTLRLVRSSRRSFTNIRSPGTPLPLSGLLTVERIKVPLDSLDKTGILWELSTLLARASGIPEHTTEVHRAVVEREAVLSTGIGNGVALPHGKSPVLEAMAMMAGTTAAPVDFQALDGEPVRLVMMMVGPASAAGLHVKTLGHVSRLLRRGSLRGRLFAAASPEEFHTLITTTDAA